MTTSDADAASELDYLITALPKAELHIHLEGSIRPATLITLARRAGVDLGCKGEAEVLDMFRFRDLRHFGELYDACTHALGRPEDFALVTEELGRDAAEQGTRYLEVTFTPGTHYRFKGIPFDEMIDAVASGAAVARRELGVEMRFILDHVRGFPITDCYQTAEWCVQGQDRGVVALGLAGHEPNGPASLYADAIRWAQAQGVPFIPHAGEAVGPQGIWDALRFDPPRIGHGFRAAQDRELVRCLRERGVVLEICPTSNLRTGAVSSLAAHPLPQLWDAGVRLTINSDDPLMFHTTLVDEYRLAVTYFGFTPTELARVSLTAVQAALLEPHARLHLEAAFRDELGRLGISV